MNNKKGQELKGIILFTLFVFIFISGVMWIGIIFFDDIPSKVYVDGKLVYEGISAGFQVSSSGFTTTVTTYRGFLYLFPYQTYTSKDVVVIGKK